MQQHQRAPSRCFHSPPAPSSHEDQRGADARRGHTRRAPPRHAEGYRPWKVRPGGAASWRSSDANCPPTWTTSSWNLSSTLRVSRTRSSSRPVACNSTSARPVDALAHRRRLHCTRISEGHLRTTVEGYRPWKVRTSGTEVPPGGASSWRSSDANCPPTWTTSAPARAPSRCSRSPPAPSAAQRSAKGTSAPPSKATDRGRFGPAARRCRPEALPLGAAATLTAPSRGPHQHQRAPSRCFHSPPAPSSHEDRRRAHPHHRRRLPTVEGSRPGVASRSCFLLAQQRR